MSTSEVVLVQGTSIKISKNKMSALAEFDASPSVECSVLDTIAREMTANGGQASEIDVTTVVSSAKEFRLGLQDNGTITVSGHWVQTNDAHKTIRTAAADKLARGIEVSFADGSKFRALALVQQRSWAAAVDGVVTATFNFRLTGDTSEVEAT